MKVEMRADLTLSFGDEAQAPLVTENATGRPNGKRAGVPDRAESADILTELIDPLLTPGQMIELFICRVLHLFLYTLVARDRRVSLVQGLRGDFAGVIDTHESGCMRFLGRRQPGIGKGFGRVVAGRAPGGSCYRPEGVVGAREQAVDRGKFTIVHSPIIAKRADLTVYSAAFLDVYPE